MGIDKSQSRAMGTSSEQTCKYSFTSQSPNCLFREFSVICCFYLAFTEQKQRKDLRKKRKKKRLMKSNLSCFLYCLVWVHVLHVQCHSLLHLPCDMRLP